MKYALTIIVLLSFSGTTLAHDAVEDKVRSTYFVVDTSGSMKTRMVEAERVLASTLSELIIRAPEAPFSRSEFRAKAVTDCDKEVVIEDLLPANIWPAPPAAKSFAKDDFTPLGSALHAVIQHAKMGPADIYLASDWAQSPGCGMTVQEAIATIPTEADLSIHPIVVRPTDFDLDIARSIARSGLVLVRGAQKPPYDDDSDELGFTEQLNRFIEAWFWFFGFLAISGLALHLGRLNTRRAIQTEADTKEIKSLQRAALYDKNENAEKTLQKLLRDIDRKRKRADRLRRHIKSPLVRRTKRTEKIASWFWRKWKNVSQWLWPWQILVGLVVSVILFIVASTPAGFKFAGLNFDNIRSAAWSALNSDFATAFAIIWIVTVFFAAREAQRRAESDEEFALATDEAGWVALAEERRVKGEARDNYRKTRNWVSGIDVRDPWYLPSKRAEDEEALRARNTFEVVKERALELALNEPLDEAVATTKQFENETDRLSGYAKLRRSENSTVSIKKLVQALIDDHKQAELSEAWKTLLEPSGASKSDLLEALDLLHPSNKQESHPS